MLKLFSFVFFCSRSPICCLQTVRCLKYPVPCNPAVETTGSGDLSDKNSAVAQTLTMNVQEIDGAIERTVLMLPEDRNDEAAEEDDPGILNGI